MTQKVVLKQLFLSPSIIKRISLTSFVFTYIIPLVVSQEAKQLIIKWHLEGKTVAECSELSGRPWSTVKSIIKKYLETGNIENQYYRGGRRKIMTSRDRSALMRTIKKQPMAKTKNIIAEFQAYNPKKVCRATIYTELKSMGYNRRERRKKVKSEPIT